VSIPRAHLSFKIKLAKHKNRDEEFFANVDKVFPLSVRMGEGGLATPMQQLDVHSQNTTVAPSGTVTPRRGPIYLQHERIGKGTFGRVYRVTDVSTGNIYAGKYVDHSDCTREVTIMSEIKHVRTSGGMKSTTR
jgi:serine/threonine protein kinase